MKRIMKRLSLICASILLCVSLVLLANLEKLQSLHAGFEYYRAFGQDATQNQEYAKTKLTMPMLALGGDHNGGSFIVSQMQAVAENVQGGALENTGHWTAKEQPEELTRQLLQFFGKD